jgi:murein DD-endopeptidase MepM/ murein hydrolase activator NlpD
MESLKKRLIGMGLAFVVAMIAIVKPLGATTIEDEKKKQEQMESELRDYESMLDDLEGLKADTEAYIVELDAQLNRLTTHMTELNNQVAAKQTQIDEMNTKLQQQEADIVVQYNAMKKRIQYMFENGNSYYLEMLLGSDSMADFLNRAEYMKEITDYDRKMLDKMKATKVEIENTKTTLEAEKQSLETMVAQVDAEKKSVDALVAGKQQQLLTTMNEIDGAISEISEMQADIETQKQIIAELEEIERKRREEEERRRQEAEKLNQQLNIPSYDGGMFMWPTPDSHRITSPYGYRTDPINGQTAFHNGVDVGAPTGTPIYAAYGGEVAWAYYSSSAGNWIGIDHGDGLYTIYMHCSALLVSQGQQVSKGTLIGRVGSTGRSTGPHLHFSVRKDGEYVDPYNYLN